jgi:hypothetical protein
MQKNTTGQKWYVFAFDRTTSSPVTGDAGNITAKVSIDYGAATALTDVNPAEVEDGYYMFDLTQAETNGDHIVILPESVTANVVVIGAPASVQTVPASFPDGVVQTGDSFARIGASGAGLTVLASATNLATAQADLDTLTGTDGVTLATSQPNYAPATAAALTTVDTEVGQVKAKTDQLTFTVANQVDANALTGGGGGDATAANQTTIINGLTDIKGAGWVAADNLAEIAEDVTGLNGAAMRGTDGANTTTPPTAAAIRTEIDANSTQLASILDDTGTSGVAISTAQAQSIADEVLKRSVGNVEGATLDEHSLATVVLAILESQRVGASWTIYRTDGTTAQATKTLTLDASAQPVTRVQ